MSENLQFELTVQDGNSRARCGRISIGGRSLQTPAFAPVATRAAVKGLLPSQLIECGVEFLLANAYHLQLAPGAELIAGQGGLHDFMGWHGIILTDSGGYQVFSLSDINEITDGGVEFRNPRDGSKMFMGPQEAVKIQERLGSDIAMVFDECPPCPCSKKKAGRAVDRTLRWAQECKETHSRENQALFGIVQGGTYEDLRSRCAQELVGMGFDGYAIGGVSVGEDEELRNRAVEMTAPLLPEGRPRYLMGVGFPPDIINAIGEGIDMFDCVAPTRMGRNATAFTRSGRLRIRNSVFKKDPAPLEEDCNCLACTLYSRAYLHHLFRTREMLGPVLLSIHNISFYQNLLSGARKAIAENGFDEYRGLFLENYCNC